MITEFKIPLVCVCLCVTEWTGWGMSSAFLLWHFTKRNGCIKSQTKKHCPSNQFVQRCLFFTAGMKRRASATALAAERGLTPKLLKETLEIKRAGPYFIGNFSVSIASFMFNSFCSRRSFLERGLRTTKEHVLDFRSPDGLIACPKHSAMPGQERRN